jgi:hypothetical protein
VQLASIITAFPGDRCIGASLLPNRDGASRYEKTLKQDVEIKNGQKKWRLKNLRISKTHF